MKWSPSFFRRPDGTYYETAIFVVEGAWEYSSAYINEADGSQRRSAGSQPRIDIRHPHPVCQGRRTACSTMESGEERVIEVEALGDSGFFLKTGGLRRMEGPQARVVEG